MTISIRKIYINQLCQDNYLRLGTGIKELILQLQLRRGRSTFMPVLFMFVTWRHKSLMLWGAPPDVLISIMISIPAPAGASPNLVERIATKINYGRPN